LQRTDLSAEQLGVLKIFERTLLCYVTEDVRAKDLKARGRCLVMGAHAAVTQHSRGTPNDHLRRAPGLMPCSCPPPALPSPRCLQEKLNQMEAELAAHRNTMNLGYEDAGGAFKKASSVSL
jgi:hypothetical protein